VLEGVGRVWKYVIFIAGSELCTSIHQDEFLARVVFYGMGRAELIFQPQTHLQEVFQYKYINVIKCHEWSPGPNPIEYLWQQLKWQLSAMRSLLPVAMCDGIG
jgi:hypothetical protein